MSLACSQEFLARMKSDKEFRSMVTGFSDGFALQNYLESAGYDFDLPEMIKAMAACMAELEQGQ